MIKGDCKITKIIILKERKEEIMSMFKKMKTIKLLI